MKPEHIRIAILSSILAIAGAAGLAARPASAPVPLKPVGKITPRPSLAGAAPRLGIGFEKLDRDVFDPEKAYDKVAAIGVKWVRLQSGWQRTEKQKGRYDFAWLDSIVDNLIRRGLTPWLCLCYGNELYTPDAKKYFGAVGVPPIKTQEERDAWANYVAATVRHFKGRIALYEIWNEPNGRNCWKHGVNPAEYGAFALATARAIRAADPAAKIAAGVLTNPDIAFISAALDTGLGDYIDAVSYHFYTTGELPMPHRYKAFAAVIHSYNPGIKVFQGESGSQSRPDGRGALRYLAWSPLRQAKINLRHLVTDLSLDMPFTSCFTSVDMIEALDGIVGKKSSYLDYGYFGVLGADFDADGRSTGDYTPKPAYYALQNLCAVFAADVTTGDIPVHFKPADDGPAGAEPKIGAGTLQSLGLKKANGARAFIYWNSTDLLTTDYDGTMTFAYARLPRPFRLADLLTGIVYEIPDAKIEKFTRSDAGQLKGLPLRDYPLLLSFGDFVSFSPGQQ
ncbi:MAG: beta-galactosidase [Opitutaceae bacterium]|jgi:hypothetical protein|nr:beta-galactosidase [Opitutaceae bacterium]